MGKLLNEIGDKEAAFIASQKVFFVATAPLDAEHHVSVSPKSPGNSCIVLGPHTVAYADLTGSGAETAAHVLQNGRMTLMFCNLEKGPPKIMRLFGQAKLILAKNVPPETLSKFPQDVTESHGFRGVFQLQVSRITTSCGYSLPVMDFQKYRQTLEEYCQNKGSDGMFDYVTLRNSFSIDGLPSVGLLRPDGPANIGPVAEDGYILGKPIREVKSNSNGAGTTKTPDSIMVQQAMAQARQMHQTKAPGDNNSIGGINLSLTSLTALMAAIFALGIWVGANTPLPSAF